MGIRIGAVVGGVIIAAVLAGVVTSRQPRPSPVGASQVDLPRSRADNADLADARKDPLAIGMRDVLGRKPATVRFLAVADASPVPVLAPADPALLSTARIFTGDQHYMLTVQRGARVIEIYGATKAFQLPITPPAATLGTAPTTTNRSSPRVQAARIPAEAARAAAQAQTRGLTNVRADRTEYGVDVAFNRFGAAYNVSFICEGPRVAGCTEREALAFVSTLRLIGGGAS